MPTCGSPLDSISRLHARLTPTGDEVLLEDLGSTNGTFLNGKRIIRAQAVHGDEIGFDTLRFRADARPAGARAGTKVRRRPAVGRGLAALALVLAGVAYWLSR